MISYEPKDWFSFLFRMHKSDTVRRLFPLMLLIAGYSWIVAYLELEFWQLSENSNVKNLTIIHSLLGFVLSLLLVFRTNTAYDRWWEGRKLWGALVNNSRNLAIQLHSMLPYDDHENRRFFSKSIALYARVLQMHLGKETVKYELDTEDHPELASVVSGKHGPNQLASTMSHRLYRLRSEGKLTQEQMMNLNPVILSFTDICGACERIKNTPIPYSYNVFIKKFIFFYVMTLPFGFVFSLGYYVVPVVVFIFFALASLEVIAEEIEDPFDGDQNDLPTDKIAESIKRHVGEILGESNT
jgi:ion channel-forming bestrophin family protein